jgi:hypothetical protein
MPVRARTIREQVEWYLVRMRHTVPFPCTPDDAYFGCVPNAVKQWHGDGLFEMDSPLPGRSTNLLTTMFATAEKQTNRRNILHVSVEDKEEFLEAQRGNRGHEGIFWIEVPEHVPVPRNSTQTPFYLPDDHPFHDAINDWAEQAFIVEDEIQEALKHMEMLAAFTSSATEIMNLWPELANFVHVAGARKGLSQQVAYKLREAFEKQVPTAARNEVTSQLTRAVMLPEKRPPLQAWVKFYTQEYE